MISYTHQARFFFLQFNCVFHRICRFIEIYDNATHLDDIDLCDREFTRGEREHAQRVELLRKKFSINVLTLS